MNRIKPQTEEKNLAPVVLFVFNRQRHTQQTIEALRNNEWADASELFVYSDGPKSETDQGKVQAIREYLKALTGFKKITVIKRDNNLGLAQSIITGVAEIVSKYGRIIVLEDDMETSPFFLRFMNEALELYKEDEKVISIHGYMYPVKAELPDTFFLKGADCWGWATWKRGWDLFETDGRKLLAELKAANLTSRFDFDGSYGYTKMLKDQVQGKNNSWAIRWYASAFLKDKLTLYPGSSLILNTGTDASGTHCNASDIFDTQVSQEPIRVKKIPTEENPTAREAIEHYFRSTKDSSIRMALETFGRIFSRHT
jgi:glycosyltransferase involved in cell wall biosynthesis